MPPKNKKKVATRTIEIAAAHETDRIVRFPYTGDALEEATDVDIEYTAVACASLLGCTECAAQVESALTPSSMEVAHLKKTGLSSASPALLEEHTDNPRVRYTEQEDKVYLRAKHAGKGPWTLVHAAQPHEIKPP